MTTTPSYTLRILDTRDDRTAPLFAAPECQELFQIYATYYAEHGFTPPWVAYWVLRDGQIVGTAGFVRAPQDGRVEIAYWTFAFYEGQGIATAACGLLLAIAREADASLIVTAKTAPEQNASTRILEQHGFRQTEVVQDHEIGDAWLWELPITR